MPQPRQPQGRPDGGEFTEVTKPTSGLSLAPAGEHDQQLPVLGDHDAQVLPEVDLTFHAADVEWAAYHRQMDADLDATEDPMYDAEGPWYGEDEDPADSSPARRAA